MPELNGLSFERLVTFMSIDLAPFGDEMRRFVDTSTYAADSPEFGSVTWQGYEWLPVPFQSGGFQRGGENMVRPSIQIGDFSGGLYALMRQLNFAPGASVMRYKAFAADVESDNPYAAFQTEQYVLANVAQQALVLQLELATHLDFASRKIPGFKMLNADAAQHDMSVMGECLHVDAEGENARRSVIHEQFAQMRQAGRVFHPAR